jgi:hypothetical protein
VAAEDVEEEEEDAVTRALEDAISEKEAVAADLVVVTASEPADNLAATATGAAAAAATSEVAVAALETLVEPGKPTHTKRMIHSFCPIQSSGATKRDLLVSCIVLEISLTLCVLHTSGNH